MAGNVTGLNVFQDAISPEPLVKLDQNFNALQTALNTLNTFSNFLVDTGTPNNLNVTAASSQYAAYADGLQVLVRIGNTNTGPATLNINNMGPKQIIFPNESALTANALLAGSIQVFVYNASLNAFQLIGIAGGALTVSSPFAVNDNNGQPLLEIKNPPIAAGAQGEKCLVTIEPGSHGTTPGDISTMLCIWGAEDAYGLKVEVGGPTTQPVWAAEFVNSNTSAAPAGIENGVHIIAGSNSGDSALRVDKRDLSSNFLNLDGDGSGAIGPSPNQLVWDTAGHFTLTGTATLPWPAIDNLPDITITNPVQGDVLSWDATTQKWVNAAPVSAVATLTDVHLTNPQNGEALVYNQATNQWVNGAPVNALAALNDVALTNVVAGQSLTYNGATQKWVNSPTITMLTGLGDVHVAGPAAGQVLTYSVSPVPGWVNATIPGYTFLTNLGVGPNPAAGWVLTWDGVAWVGAAPGQVAAFPLSSLTDVGITTPLNRQVLTYDAPNAKWINAPAPSPSLATLPDVTLTSQTQGQVLAWDATLHRWVNSALPGGSVIALDTLMDTNISDPQNNQVLTWDYASARWVNRALPPVFTPVLTSPSAGQVLSWNGTNWVNSTIPAQALANLSDVALTGTGAAMDGNLLTYNNTTGKWQNNGWAWLTAVGSAHDAFTVYGGAGHWAGYFKASDGGTGLLVQAGSGPSDYPFVVRNPTGDWLFSIDGVGGGALGVSGARMSWGGNGFTIEAPPLPSGSSGGTLTIEGPAGLFNWGEIINGKQTGCGLLINAGNTATEYSLLVQSYDGVDAFQILGDGSGVLGPYSGRLRWQTDGSWSLSNWLAVNYGGQNVLQTYNNNSATSLRVQGLSNYGALYVASGNNTNGGVYPMTIVNTASSPGVNHGLYISAAWNNNDFAINAIGLAGSTLLCVAGDGAIYCTPRASGTYDYACYTRNSAEIVRYSSSARYKQEMRSMQRARVKEVISKLRPVSYRSKVEYDDQTQLCYGLIAEEVETVDPMLVTHDAQGRPDAVRYQAVNMMLLSLMQELLGMDEPEGEVYG